MTHVSNIRGIVNMSGTTEVTSSAVGDGATVVIGRTGPERSTTSRSHRVCDVGIVTVLPEEARAVIDVLGLDEDADSAEPQRFHIGTVELPDQDIRVVAGQALRPGQRSVMSTLGRLHRQYDPAVFVFVGIAGAIHEDVSLDDVLVATRVIYYDLRKETPEGVRRRGEEREAPAAVVHAVNAFFTDHGEPAELQAPSVSGAGKAYRVFHSPIGSGEAVVADRASEIRRFLTSYNDKVLAVDMESGGLTQFCHETASRGGGAVGWLVIRGISDHADHAKGDDHHQSACLHAAHTLQRIIPYIRSRPRRH